MAVFEELNRSSERLQDPEARKAGKIERAAPAKRKKRPGSTSVSLSTYKKTGFFINIGVVLLVIGVIAFFGYHAIRLFIE